MDGGQQEWQEYEIKWQLAFIRPGLSWATMNWFSEMSLEEDRNPFEEKGND